MTTPTLKSAIQRAVAQLFAEQPVTPERTEEIILAEITRHNHQWDVKELTNVSCA